MSNADWFARKLGTNPQHQHVQPLAPAVNGLRLPPVQHQAPQPVPQQAVSHTQQITGKENFQGLLDEAHRNGEAVTFTKLSRNWHGGEAMRTEGHLRCPNCDSMNIFTRTNIRIMNENTGAMGHARPRCFDCGWTEGFVIGDKGNWGGS